MPLTDQPLHAAWLFFFSLPSLTSRVLLSWNVPKKGIINLGREKHKWQIWSYIWQPKAVNQIAASMVQQAAAAAIPLQVVLVCQIKLQRQYQSKPANRRRSFVFELISYTVGGTGWPAHSRGTFHQDQLEVKRVSSWVRWSVGVKVDDVIKKCLKRITVWHQSVCDWQYSQLGITYYGHDLKRSFNILQSPLTDR